jgi:hypothetical protein
MLLSTSQGEGYYARGCAVVTYFGYFCYGLLRCVNIHRVYVFGIGCKILLSLMYIQICAFLSVRNLSTD